MARETESEMREWIKRRLGSGTICVELTIEQLDDAIKHAKDYWASWVGQAKMTLLTATGVSEYAEALIGTDVDTVVEVNFPIQNDLTRMFAWADVQVNPYSWVYQGYGGYNALVQLQQYVKDGSRILSADVDWEWDKIQRKLRVRPALTSGQQFGVIYLSREIDVGRLTNYEYWLFKEYALVQAMKVLGVIRMKYSDKPSATGSFTMDGDAMWANAEVKENELEEKMRALQSPVGFWTG